MMGTKKRIPTPQKQPAGSLPRTLVTRDQINVGRVLESVSDQGAGATVLFLGTVRNSGEMGEVREVTYEAYVPLAKKALEDIGREMATRWPVRKATVVHRVGRLGLGEASVAIAVSSAHRSEAFEACRFAIERIKVAAPIWKKEALTCGAEVWTEGKEMAGVRA